MVCLPSARYGGHGEHRDLLEKSLCGPGKGGNPGTGRERQARQTSPRSQDRCWGCRVARHPGSGRTAAGFLRSPGTTTGAAADRPTAAKAGGYALIGEKPPAQGADRWRNSTGGGGQRYPWAIGPAHDPGPDSGEVPRRPYSDWPADGSKPARRRSWMPCKAS